MITYTVFIRDQVDDFTSKKVERREVLVRGSFLSYQIAEGYNPNETSPFNEEGPFTDATIGSTLEKIAHKIVQNHMTMEKQNGFKADDLELKVDYKTSFGMAVKGDQKFLEYGLNEDQQKCLNKKISRKYNQIRAERDDKPLRKYGREHEKGMAAAEIVAKGKE